MPRAHTIKIIGVGGAGVSLLDTLNGEGICGRKFCGGQHGNGAPSLAVSSATVKIHLETKLLRGLGTGGAIPYAGRAIAEEQFATLKSACEGADVVLIVAGLGGSANSGISPVLARAAKETGRARAGVCHAAVHVAKPWPPPAAGEAKFGTIKIRRGRRHLFAEPEGIQAD